jgi:hypothetical protein
VPKQRRKDFDMKSILHHLSHAVKRRIRRRYVNRSFERSPRESSENIFHRGFNKVSSPIFLALEGSQMSHMSSDNGEPIPGTRLLAARAEHTDSTSPHLMNARLTHEQSAGLGSGVDILETNQSLSRN